ncbi:MAG: PA domain-containing protein, partial [Planctomycetaceae bacterium]
MRPFAFTAFLIFLATIGTAQEKTEDAKPDKADAAETKQDDAVAVDPDALERVSKDIQYLASDELEGRGVETKGLAVAADYIRDEFKKAGVKSGSGDDSYFQYFDVELREKPIDVSKTSVKLVMDGKVAELERGEQFQALTVGASAEAFGDIVFAGYGITAPEFEYDDYADIDVKDKVVLIIRREPESDDEDVFDGSKTTSHSYVATKISAARKAGAKAILFVNDSGTKPDTAMATNSFGASSGTAIPFIHITRETADQLIAASPIEAGDKKFTTIEEAEAYLNSEL